MGKMLLCNPDIKPTPEIIADGLGDANPVYTEFVEELKKYDVEGDITMTKRHGLQKGNIDGLPQEVQKK